VAGVGIPADALAGIRAVFFEECEEHLAELERGLEALSHDLGGPDAIDTVFRAAHSIKGGAGIFELSEVVRIAHLMESALAEGRKDAAWLTRRACKVLLRALDGLADLIHAARDGAPADAARAGELQVMLSGLIEAPADQVQDVEDEFGFVPQPVNLQALNLSPAGETTFRIAFKPHARLYATGNEPLALIAELERLGRLAATCDAASLPPLDRLDPEESYLAWSLVLETDADEAQVREVFEFVEDDCDLEIARLEAAPSAPSAEPGVLQTIAPRPQARSAPAAAAQQPTIRVDLERVEKLIDLVSELVINQAILAQQIQGEALAKTSGVPAALEDLDQLTRQIQDSVMAIRAQPVKAVFQRMARLAREMESLTGKPVRLVTEGEMTEVDRTVIEHLTDPLTHMVRNAIDHGLEAPEVRAAAGKPVEGVVRLAASHRAGRIIIEVSDDGAGIDHDQVRAKAVQAGLVAADAPLTPEEIENLIFEPGFSTAAEVSDFSGRGVGMDVVKRSVQALGGRISVSSELGRGSTFTLSLPLTLAVLDGMLVSVRGQSLVAPLTALVETVQVADADVRSLGPDGRLLAIRGGHLPLIDLGEALGYSAALPTGERAVALLVEDTLGQRAALLVDEIHGQRQVVIKSLEANYRHIPGVAAATILGDGRVALILDIESVLDGERRGQPPRSEAA
jgi:two-component system chemotaxis sensor kinase CheA